MNKTLMITVSVAALVAAGSVAYAQGVNEPRDKPAVAAPGHAATPGVKGDSLKPETHKAEAVKPAPSAQLPAKPAATKSETSGQGTGMQPAQRDATTPGSARVAPQADAKHAAPAALSSEQHAKMWDTIRGEKAARFTGERFAMTLGEMVPQTVHLYRLPDSVFVYAPQYRGYEYIQVGEDILIVDPSTHLIVAVIAA
jgi:hypothetical protein